MRHFPRGQYSSLADPESFPRRAENVIYAMAIATSGSYCDATLK
jgi:hypothetical protein